MNADTTAFYQALERLKGSLTVAEAAIERTRKDLNQIESILSLNAYLKVEPDQDPPEWLSQEMRDHWDDADIPDDPPNSLQPGIPQNGE